MRRASRESIMYPSILSVAPIRRIELRNPGISGGLLPLDQRRKIGSAGNFEIPPLGV
jgi:hypothetical protein